VADGLLVLAGVTGEPAGRSSAASCWTPRWTGSATSAGVLRHGRRRRGPALPPGRPADGPSPSGTFAVAGALLSYAALTGSQRHRDAARAALGPLPAIAGRFPSAAGAGLTVAAALLSGPAEIAIVGPPGDPRTGELHKAALRGAPPGAVLALGDGSAGDGTIPLLAGRGLVNGAPAAYVCRDFTCRLPVTSPDELGEVLASGW
jgi:uncharacterized protein YyaL (SSP411 family)